MSRLRELGLTIGHYFGLDTRPEEPDPTPGELLLVFVKAVVIIGTAYAVRAWIGVEEGIEGFLVLLGVVVALALVWRIGRALVER